MMGHIVDFLMCLDRYVVWEGDWFYVQTAVFMVAITLFANYLGGIDE